MRLSEEPVYTLNCRGTLLSLAQPVLMGILNLTPDSFSDGGRYHELPAALAHTGEMLAAGARIIDVGAYSSRPGADDIPEAEELARLQSVVPALLTTYPDALFSLDTFRAGVARAMLEQGVHLINDISAGQLDPAMLETVAAFGDVPYIMMHMKGTPQTMKELAQYEDLTGEVWAYFVDRIEAARAVGLRDLVLDPGFGFAKTIAHNYELLYALDAFGELGLPLLAGLSRKSMMYRVLSVAPDETVAVGQALHWKALEQGARILRVHDVAEAQQTVTLFNYVKQHGII
jgi:dihydropteroate synthase